MADRLPLVRKGGQNVQQTAGDGLRLVGPLNQTDFDFVSAASTTDLTAVQSDSVIVAGAGTIAGLGNAASGGAFNGARRLLNFRSAGITLAHDPDRLVLFGSNIVTLADDRAEFTYRGAGKWQCLWYARSDGTALVGSPFTGGTLTTALNEASYTGLDTSGLTTATFQTTNNLVYTSSALPSLPSLTSGARRLMIFNTTCTITNSSSLKLPTNADIVAAPGDRAEFSCNGGTTWTCIWFQRADGTALASSGSGGASTYTFTQSSALATWTIPHNLNRYPSVTVVDTLGNVIVPDVSYVDSNTVQVTHGAAYAGKAYLN